MGDGIIDQKGRAVQLIERVQDVLFHPQAAWYVIEPETTAPIDLYKSYILPLAAIGPVSAFIGMALVGISLPFVGTYRVPWGSALASSLMGYGLALGGVYLLALIIDMLAPYFSAQPDSRQALKLAAYASTPAWIGGIFALIPGMSLLGLLLSLYSLYLLFLGLPVLMKAPREKALPYVALSVLGAILIAFVASRLSQVFIKPPPLPAVPEPPP